LAPPTRPIRAPGPTTFIPEVVQTSATDCGPAAMKSVMAGMGLRIEYRRLREACQTDVDGSSIDKLEELAVQLGADAEQMMLPVDHVFLPESRALPAIIVSLTPGGRPHFLVIWKRIGPFVQVMDPASGRHWTTVEAMQSRLFVHSTPVPAEAWREWAGTEQATLALRRRLRALGASSVEPLLDAALADHGWRALATLDAAARAVEAVVRGGGVGRGRAAHALVRSMVDQQNAGAVAIPETYWSVRELPAGEGPEDATAPQQQDAPAEQVLLKGAVLLRFAGWRDGLAPGDASAEAGARDTSKLSPDLVGALAAPDVNPGRTLRNLLKQDPVDVPLLVTGGLVLATAGKVAQAVMLRAVLELGRDLVTVKQRFLGMLLMATFALVLTLIQIPVSVGLLGIGRRLEIRLRKAYLESLPRIEDRYFQSRLASDMASRCHAMQGMRTLPTVMGQFVTTSLELLATAGALIWAAPNQWPITVALLGLTLLLPLVAQFFFFERDMRVQTHTGALTVFILDALLGLSAIRIHGAERSLRRGQESMLVEWTRARHALQKLSVVFEALLATATYGLVVLLVFSYLKGNSKASLVLLLVFWALRFPAIGQRLLVLTRAYPSMMNRVRRLLEMLDNAEADAAPAATTSAASREVPAVTGPNPVGGHLRGVSIALDRVQVKGGGNVLLDKVSLQIQAGEHVAIVGPSGAGKSTLVGLLLGWLRPAKGAVSVDGRPLDQEALEQLRRVTAWVDPAIQLWNQSLLDNLRYGNDSSRTWSLDQALRAADLHDILEALPEGLQTALGEGGGLVSGGQGQRVRLARAMLRTNVRLAILDEAFRGLDRQRRASLMKEARKLWSEITLLCVSHDVVQTCDFDRVLVIEHGRLVENGQPQELLSDPHSRYAQLVRADEENHRALWRGGDWRNWRLSQGRLEERPGA
jgi:ABC-type bacteriocin/lantibiotic exporter with double-glycine peptidase domain